MAMRVEDHKHGADGEALAKEKVAVAHDAHARRHEATGSIGARRPLGGCGR